MKPKPASNKSVQALRELAEAYFRESFERFPVFGGGSGLKQYNPLLGRATPEVYAAQGALARKTLAALRQLPVHDFEGDSWLDRMELRSVLIKEIESIDERKTWQTNPQVYLEAAADSLYSLIVRHADDLRPVADALVSRLRAMPKYLDEAAGCVKLPVPLWAKLAGKSAPGVRSLIESLPAQLAAATKHPRAALDKWAAEASRAVDLYAARVAKKKTGPTNGFSLGRERFDAMIREQLGLSLTAEEAVAAARGLIDRLKAEMSAEAKKFHPKKGAVEILEEAAHQWEMGAPTLREAYEKQAATMKSKFQGADAMTFPKGDRLLVKLVPDFMAHQFPTAAYSSPGALDPDQTGIFWVNDLSLKKKGEAEKRAEIEQHFGLELTSAHEAYPGHHLQFVMQHKNPSLVRKLASHSIYYEGWTLWCEQMSVDLKVSDNPYLKLQQLHDALWRANRIVIDCGLHTGDLNFRSACKLLEENVGFTRARAEGDVNWYTSSPTVPMSYLLGKMELTRLKRQRVDQGGWTLRRFNDWVLGFGSIPWGWIEASGL